MSTTVHEAVSVTYSTASGRMAATYVFDSSTKPGRSRVSGYNRDRGEAAVEAAVRAVENLRTREGFDPAEWASADRAVVGQVARNAYVVTFLGTSA